MEHRVCKICGSEKELSKEFFYCRKAGFRWECIVCALQNRKNRYLEIKDDRAIYIRQYYQENKDSVKEQQKEYQVENREQISSYRKKYYQNNKDEIIFKNREAAKARRKVDPSFRLRKDISTRIGKELKKHSASKDSSILKHLPFSIEELKAHLEAQFEPWMTWANHGKYNSKTWDDADITTWTWQIDHIIPQSQLPYASMLDDNFCKCWAVTNLRPLSAKQNVIDGDRR